MSAPFALGVELPAPATRSISKEIAALQIESRGVNAPPMLEAMAWTFRSPLTIVGLAIGAASLVVAYLAWRHPRAAPQSPPAESQRDDEERQDEGLALVLGLLWVARNRRKARTQEPADPN